MHSSPGTPTGIGWSRASKTHIWVFAIGRPIEMTPSPGSTRHADDHTVLSVGPYTPTLTWRAGAGRRPDSATAPRLHTAPSGPGSRSNPTPAADAPSPASLASPPRRLTTSD